MRVWPALSWPALSLIACTSLLPAIAQTKPVETQATPDLAQQELARFEKKVTTKVLPNGLTVLLIERPEAPVFSYYTLVDAGDANDPTGESGLAHMFEHLAFKGTDEIGTTNWPAEKVALKKVEDAYAAYDAEYRKRVGQDPAKLKQLRDAFDAAKKDAQQYVIPNQFTEIAEENGASGINASTGLDSTEYFWSMPANRLQLWAYMESGRIGTPRTARVLQRARRGDGRAAHAYRFQSDRADGGAVPGDSVCRAPLWAPRGGLGVGALADRRHGGRDLPQEVLHARRTW